MKSSQYPTKRITTQAINPSIPLPSIVRHACITARIAAIIISSFHEERRLARAEPSFSGISFIAYGFLHEDATIKSLLKIWWQFDLLGKSCNQPAVQLLAKQ
jgi:hypothetical protein